MRNRAFDASNSDVGFPVFLVFGVDQTVEGANAQGRGRPPILSIERLTTHQHSVKTLGRITWLCCAAATSTDACSRH